MLQHLPRAIAIAWMSKLCRGAPLPSRLVFAALRVSSSPHHAAQYVCARANQFHHGVSTRLGGICRSVAHASADTVTLTRAHARASFALRVAWSVNIPRSHEIQHDVPAENSLSTVDSHNSPAVASRRVSSVKLINFDSRLRTGIGSPIS